MGGTVLTVADPGFPDGEPPIPRFGDKTYYLARVFQKTARKCQKLDREGRSFGLPAVPGSANG